MAKEKKQSSMEASLWNSCNKLRGSVSATDYVNVVLGLLFLRFAYDKFDAQRQRLLDDPDSRDFVDNPRFYTKDNVFYLGEEDRWPFIVHTSKTNKIYTNIDAAFKNMEKANPSLKGALPIGFYPQLHIEPSKFSSLIDEIAKMQYSKDETDDVIGRVYEYFLRKFCIAAKSEKGEFYTPGNIVELMTQIIQPYAGKVYDPCCGSGGMFVQSAEFIKRHKGNKLPDRLRQKSNLENEMKNDRLLYRVNQFITDDLKAHIESSLYEILQLLDARIEEAKLHDEAEKERVSREYIEAVKMADEKVAETYKTIPKSWQSELLEEMPKLSQMSNAVQINAYVQKKHGADLTEENKKKLDELSLLDQWYGKKKDQMLALLNEIASEGIIKLVKG